MPSRPILCAFVLLTTSLVACSGGKSDNGSGSSVAGGTGTGGHSSGSGGAGGGSVIVLPSGGASAGGAGSDQCNTLRIATIGRLGPWGTSTLFSAWLQKEGTQPAVDLGDTVLTADVLSKYDVIVALNLSQFAIVYHGKPLDNDMSHAYSDAEASALEAWVKNGGGVMSTIGYTSNEGQEQLNIDKLLGFANMGYSTTQLDADGDVTRFDPHPTTTNVLKLAIQNGVRPAGSGGTVIGWDAQDREALMVGSAGSGHIVVWGDEWITYDEYWGSRPDLNIEVFWVNVMNWLAPAKACKLPILIH